MKFRKKFSSFPRRAFTLIEILTVVAIIGMMAVVIVGLRPGNPRGMDDACRMAGLEFRVAQARAIQGNNPDREPDTNKRYNIRTAVLVLDNEDDYENHLRKMQIIVGGTDDPSKSDLNDYYWYLSGEPALLPENIYFVPPGTEGLTATSKVKPLEGNEKIRLDPTTESGGKKAGTGTKQWYAYYFDTNGQSYMSKATFLIAKGAVIPGSGVQFENNAVVQGFAITRNGGIVYTRDEDEAEVADKE